MAKNTKVEIGSFVKVAGNSGAWETGFVKAINEEGKALIGFGSRNTPEFFLRYGEMNLIPADQLEVI